MDEETADRIVSKAEFVQRCVDDLSQYQSLSKAEYLDDPDVQAIVERRFETAIQACIDISGMILRADAGTVPEAYSDRMRALVSLGVLSDSLGETMAATTGFRNVLAHRYGTDLDNELVYMSLQDLSRFYHYLRAVREYLDSVGLL